MALPSSMERFVLAMDQIAFGHGAFLILHGAFSHRLWNIRPFNRLVLEMHRLDSQSDRLVFQIDRRVFQIDRRVFSSKPVYQHFLPWRVANAAKGRGRIAFMLHTPSVPFAERMIRPVLIRLAAPHRTRYEKSRRMKTRLRNGSSTFSMNHLRREWIAARLGCLRATTTIPA